MRLLIFHGYLLRGTGSNVYTAELAAALAREGHEVHLLCQDPAPEELPWVDAVGGWRDGRLEVVARREPARVTVYRPPIGRLLPVYVADRYEGFEARPFPDLSDAELEDYVARNVGAVRDVAARGQVEGALAGHLVMGPAIAARAGLRAAVKIHGSALEYVVAPHPRFLPWAREGLAPAPAVLVGSAHVARRLWEVVDDPALPRRTRLGPPGVDVRRFRPRPTATLGALRARLAGAQAGGGGSFARDPDAALRALEPLDPRVGPLVAYVGKLLAGKGVELLAAAWPDVRQAVPGAQLAVVGFGDDDGGLGALGDQGVHLLGRLEHDELAELLPACRAIAVPSTFPEAFGMVAVEGAACGAFPVVAGHSGLAEVAATLAPALPEAARPWLTFALGPGAATALADRLVAVLTSRLELREPLAAAVRARYSWEGVARGVVAAARGALDELPAPRIGSPPS